MRAALLVALLTLAAFAAPADAFRCYQEPIQVHDCKFAPPMALVGAVQEDGVHLQWEAPLLGAVSGYLVHRVSHGGVEEVFDAGLATEFVDLPPLDGVYVYFVTGKYGQRESAPSNPFAAAWPYCPPISVDMDEIEMKLTGAVEYNSGCVFPLPFVPVGP